MTQASLAFTAIGRDLLFSVSSGNSEQSQPRVLARVPELESLETLRVLVLESFDQPVNIFDRALFGNEPLRIFAHHVPVLVRCILICLKFAFKIHRLLFVPARRIVLACLIEIQSLHFSQKLIKVRPRVAFFRFYGIALIRVVL